MSIYRGGVRLEGAQAISSHDLRFGPLDPLAPTDGSGSNFYQPMCLDPTEAGVSWWQQVPRNHLLGSQNSLSEGPGVLVWFLLI